VLHRVFRCRRFTLGEQCAGEDAPRPGFVVADFLWLKNFESLADRSFLFGRGTRASRLSVSGDEPFPSPVIFFWWWSVGSGDARVRG
jgi:hypothetical protein